MRKTISSVIFSILFVGILSAGAYTVIDGDTLWKIAEDNNTTVEELSAVNSISNPNLIYVGQDLLLSEQIGLLGGAPFRPSDIEVAIREDIVAGASRSGTTLDINPIIGFDGLRWEMATSGDILFGTLSQGTNQKEIISWTGMTDNSTYYTLTGIEWGYRSDSLATTTANYKRHNSGAKLLITNDDHFLNRQFVNTRSEQTIIGVKTFSLPPYSTLTATSGTQLINLNQANSLANTGGASSTESQIGFSTLATTQENASSTVFEILDPHVQQSQHSSSTPSATIATTNDGIWDIWSDNTGKLSQLWLDLTENFTFSGENSFSATTTMATTTVANLNLPYRYGDGSDGVTTTPEFYEDKIWNFTSLTIPTGETSVTTLSDTPIYVRVQGDCIIEGTLDVSGAGALGGDGGTGGTGTDGATSTPASFLEKNNLAGNGVSPGGAATGGGGYNPIEYSLSEIYGISTSTSNILFGGGFIALTGSGGGGGGNIGSSVGGDGGNGGGAIVIYCGGSITFTGTITADGEDGGDAVCNASDDAGGGGGGAAGFAGLFGNKFLYNSGTISADGGAGGSKCDNGNPGQDGSDGIALSGSMQY